MIEQLPITIVIPTYGREQILIDTLVHLHNLDAGAREILVIDQTEKHDLATAESLLTLESKGVIRRLCLTRPSITHAMNIGLLEAQHEVVLFLDDDIIPGSNLVAAHLEAHRAGATAIIAGQVLQPWEEETLSDEGNGPFRFSSGRRQWITELMGGNFSIRLDTALRLGGFDENFVQVAYRFEAEFADRALAAGEKILFEPAAGIRHLKAERGGTRSYGDHLTTLRPGHAVGAYYYLLRSTRVRHRLWQMLMRPLRAIRTRHHLQRPWWILPTLIAELAGFVWAVSLAMRGPRLIRHEIPGEDR